VELSDPRWTAAEARRALDSLGMTADEMRPLLDASAEALGDILPAAVALTAPPEVIRELYGAPEGGEE
jgi:hypothetical protein